MTKLDTFTEAYIDAALWSSTDDNDEPLDNGEYELSDDARAAMIEDCRSFQAAHADLLARWYSEASETEERAGHDFWLTRNGHGAGYWDRWSNGGVEEQIGRELTEAACAYGSADLYVGDDGKVYQL